MTGKTDDADVAEAWALRESAERRTKKQKKKKAQLNSIDARKAKSVRTASGERTHAVVEFCRLDVRAST